MFFKTTPTTTAVTNSVAVGFTQPVSSSERNQAGTTEWAIPASTKTANREEYPVADFVGRCFLWVCFWFDVCTSWAKKHNRPAFTAAGAKAQSIQINPSSATMPAPIPQVRPTIATSRRTES